MIPDIYKGKPLYASDLRELCAEVKSNRVTSVVGGRFQRGIHGTTIIIPDATSTSSSSTPTVALEYPFKLFNAGDSVKINENSFLLKDVTGDTIDILNLEMFYCIPSLGQQIILEVTIDPWGIPLEAELKCGSWQTIWPSYTNPIVRNQTTKIQEKLIVGIGECSTPDDTRDGFLFGSEEGISTKVVQLVKTDLCCFLTQAKGLPAVLAMPWHRHNQVQ